MTATEEDFAAIDTDGDGELSEDELAVVRSAFHIAFCGVCSAFVFSGRGVFRCFCCDCGVSRLRNGVLRNFGASSFPSYGFARDPSGRRSPP